MAIFALTLLPQTTWDLLIGTLTGNTLTKPAHASSSSNTLVSWKSGV
jgi:hypothetical protein